LKRQNSDAQKCKEKKKRPGCGVKGEEHIDGEQKTRKDSLAKKVCSKSYRKRGNCKERDSHEKQGKGSGKFFEKKRRAGHRGLQTREVNLRGSTGGGKKKKEIKPGGKSGNARNRASGHKCGPRRGQKRRKICHAKRGEKKKGRRGGIVAEKRKGNA